jgi:hypothetical protein
VANAKHTATRRERVLARAASVLTLAASVSAFSPVAGVSGWAATCANWSDPMSCLSYSPGPPDPDLGPYPYTGTSAISLPWTDVTYLLHKHNVS